MWLQLSGAILPPRPSGARSHSAEWRARFETKAALVNASKSAALQASKSEEATQAGTASDDAPEPMWLQAAGEVLTQPTLAAGPAAAPGASQDAARQDELRLEELDPDSFLAQLIMASQPAPSQYG